MSQTRICIVVLHLARFPLALLGFLSVVFVRSRALSHLILFHIFHWNKYLVIVMRIYPNVRVKCSREKKEGITTVQDSQSNRAYAERKRENPIERQNEEKKKRTNSEWSTGRTMNKTIVF